MRSDLWAHLELGAALALILGSLATAFSQTSLSTPEFAELQQQARTACECEHAGRQGCWTNFEKRVEQRGGQISGSACAPIATVVACFGDQGRCVVMKYVYVLGRGGGTLLCNAHDAQAIDHAFSATLAKTGDDAQAQAEMERVVAAIARGEPVKIAAAEPGCAG